MINRTFSLFYFLLCLISSSLLLKSEEPKSGDADKVGGQPIIDTTRNFELPNSEVLAKNRPSPSIVRGLNIGGTRTLEADKMRVIIHDAKSWGANVLRLPIEPYEFARGQKKPMWDVWPEYLNRIEETVKIAREVGIKLVIDLHSPPVEQIMEKDGRDLHLLWTDPETPKSYIKVWNDIAERLKSYQDAIWAYDIYNEPVDRSTYPKPPKEWYYLAADIVTAIRKIDSNVWIIYESGPGGMPLGFKSLQPLPDSRIIYGCHIYSPGSFTHQGINYSGDLYQAEALESKKIIGVHYPTTSKDGKTVDKKFIEEYLNKVADFQKKWNVPIYIGEFSVARWAPKEDAIHWLTDVMDICEEHNWSWCYHAFREYHAWSLEHDETFWKKGMPSPKPVQGMTERGSIVKKYLERNSITK